MNWLDQIFRFLFFIWAMVMLGGIAWALLGSLIERGQPNHSRLRGNGNGQGVSLLQRTHSIPATFYVAGVSHANLDGSSRQNMLSILGSSDVLWIEREPSNPHDPNALRVLSRHGQIGYVPRQLAAKLKGLPVAEMHVEMHSKGRAENGLWGCHVRLSYGALEPRGTPIGVGDKATMPLQQNKSPGGLQLGQDGRAYFDAIFLAALNNELFGVLSPEDDLRVHHRSLGQGQIVGVRTREGREALFEVSFADNPDGSGDYSASTFASDLFRGEALLASVKKDAYEKYRQCFSNASLEHINEARAGMYKMTKELSGSWQSSFNPDTYWMDYDFDEERRLAQEEQYREQTDAGFSWHDYHKHD
ncbi:HIRAN domain-containing protein [Stutzerimonas nitrititolerans]|uniref:HIRAN domain-containing protein n=1 Tax=Stutzerimonas nitrititolerans TaxID=2482751 RepID=UPI0028B126CD|nr:HIRAN domain-containing protein [Stutzerimonas nitrititolerans]